MHSFFVRLISNIYKCSFILVFDIRACRKQLKQELITFTLQCCQCTYKMHCLSQLETRANQSHTSSPIQHFSSSHHLIINWPAFNLDRILNSPIKHFK